MPPTPLDLEAIYENFIFPPIRASGDVASLRDAWIKRIRQEGVLNGSDDQNAPKSDVYEKFVKGKLPELQWQMEVDLFRHGDEAEAVDFGTPLNEWSNWTGFCEMAVLRRGGTWGT